MQLSSGATLSIDDLLSTGAQLHLTTDRSSSISGSATAAAGSKVVYAVQLWFQRYKMTKMMGLVQRDKHDLLIKRGEPATLVHALRYLIRDFEQYDYNMIDEPVKRRYSGSLSVLEDCITCPEVQGVECAKQGEWGCLLLLI